LEDRDSDDKNIKKLASSEDPLKHKLVRQILPEYLEQISELQATKTDLEVQIKPTNGGQDTEEDEPEQTAQELSAEEIKAIRKEIAGLRKQLRTLHVDFVDRLQQAIAALDDEAAALLVVVILRSELQSIIDRYIARHRRAIVEVFETWWDKYRLTLHAIEQDRDAAADQLADDLLALGYVG
jgi:type I restriction enzyme M protein